MSARKTENAARRVAVILGPGGSSQNLLDVVLPLLGNGNGKGKGKVTEMRGVFLEEAELRHATDLPFVKELCRLTFDVREFDSAQFEQVLALRIRTAKRALSVLARRAGVAHSFQNIRGSAVRLLLETASQSDIVVFEPIRTMAMAMAARPRPGLSANRIVVAIDELAPAGRALAVAARLANGETDRITVLLTRLAASDPEALKRLYKKRLKGTPGRVRNIPDYDASNLAAFAAHEGAAMLVLYAAPGFLAPDNLQVLRQRMRCPVCLVR
jgi:hypothetical protein